MLRIKVNAMLSMLWVTWSPPFALLHFDTCHGIFLDKDCRAAVVGLPCNNVQHMLNIYLSDGRFLIILIDWVIL